MKSIWIAAAVMASLAASPASAMKPVTIADQGSFMAGGTVVTAPGAYGGNTNPLNQAGQTLHGDHAYVFYQIPAQAHNTALVFLHGYGQSGKTWETTPDGRDGFQNIFLEKGYKTYIADQPRRGRVGRSTEPQAIGAVPDDQLWYNNFRIGQWPQKFDNVQVRDDAVWRDQFFRQMTPDTGAYDEAVISDAMKAVFDKAGDGVFITHSQGGGPGWRTAIKSSHVKGIIALEPGTFFFPEGQVPPVEETTSPFPAAGVGVPMDDFMKLTRIPVLVLYGGNIPAEQTPVWGLDNWRVRLNLAKAWVDAVNRCGGDATLIYLPDIGIYGNTHFLMSDLNNRDVADVMERWMKEKHFD
ncbi:alpha/beta hydrolase [Megasphaera sp. ASD88]|uniref:alpha/beta hydrolase n=1 Tax=Megasphaera sp. ASD88 TaxID=2027407 RepID=UPI000BABC195|nr:alpha/beta fold hydrolase [Megasphaera sp. ASD88]PAV38610.1 alpha/beta hydrolase [Megasphaera sp. ASD88]